MKNVKNSRKNARELVKVDCLDFLIRVPLDEPVKDVMILRKAISDLGYKAVAPSKFGVTIFSKRKRVKDDLMNTLP